MWLFVLYHFAISFFLSQICSELFFIRWQTLLPLCFSRYDITAISTNRVERLMEVKNRVEWRVNLGPNIINFWEVYIKLQHLVRRIILAVLTVTVNYTIWLVKVKMNIFMTYLGWQWKHLQMSPPLLPAWNRKKVLSRWSSRGIIVMAKSLIGKFLKLSKVLFSGRVEEKEHGSLQILLQWKYWT